MSPEEQLAHNAKQGAPLQQQSDFISSDIQLAVGLNLISKVDFNNWFQANREGLKIEANDAIYKSLRSKETEATKRQMEAKGIKFVDYKKVDYSGMPTSWEVESFKTEPGMGGKTLVCIRKAKDAYSFTRQHILLADLCENFTSQSVEDLLDYNLESSRSMWAAKSKQVREKDAGLQTEAIKQQVSDDLGPAAKVVADFNMMTPLEKASALSETAFRDRFLAADKLIKSAKAFV